VCKTSFGGVSPRSVITASVSIYFELSTSYFYEFYSELSFVTINFVIYMIQYILYCTQMDILL